MNGAAALHYLQRRLAEYGLAVGPDREAELYDYLTEGRDELLKVFGAAAPLVAKKRITLGPDPADQQLYTFPADTADPYRVLRVYDSGTGEELTPASMLNFDGGHYAWDTIRSIRLADFVTLTGALTVDAVLAGGAIDATTADSFAAWGIPTTTHRAACKWAAVLALTADEESDASQATNQFMREIDQLEKLYGDFDGSGGLALREAFMRSIGEEFGDTTY